MNIKALATLALLLVQLRITGHPTNEVRRLSADPRVDFSISFSGARHLLLLSKNSDPVSAISRSTPTARLCAQRTVTGMNRLASAFERTAMR